eukprot:gene4339-4758_t
MKSGRIVASRHLHDSTSSELVYHGFDNQSLPGNSLKITENTYLVDGIGGVTWEGALVLAACLDLLSSSINSTDVHPNPLRILELGAGAGLVGLVAAKLGFTVTLTDRFIDLAEENAIANGLKDTVVVSQLDWSEGLSEEGGGGGGGGGSVDVVCGAEIACLRKQHDDLLRLLSTCLQRNPNLVILLTVDGLRENSSQYERELSQRLTGLGHGHGVGHLAQATVLAGTVHWSSPSSGQSHAVFHMEDITGRGSQEEEEEVNSGHRVLAFFPSAYRALCQRCKHPFPAKSGNPLALLPTCRFHPGLFVCRYHPAEVRCSISGNGDGLGYYSTGEEGWPARFWDCCGAEEQSAPGCVWDRHIAY